MAPYFVSFVSHDADSCYLQLPVGGVIVGRPYLALPISISSIDGHRANDPHCDLNFFFSDLYRLEFSVISERER